MTRFVTGAVAGAAIGYGVWRYQYPATPRGWWVESGALAFGILYAWFGDRLLDAIGEWLWYRR